VRFIGFGLLAVVVVGLFWMVWREGQASTSGYLFGMPSVEAEASYCLAVAERIREITGERGPRVLERHIDEQIVFWRARTGSAFAPGRAALSRDSHLPGVNEGAHLHLAVQDCGLRAIAFYGHRFSPLE